MADQLLGEIRVFGFNFAPAGWAKCNGQMMSISQNLALWDILGDRFGGNGITTFALPDLRGRIPMHFGQGAGLSERFVGDRDGVVEHPLLESEMPVHTHSLHAVSTAGDTRFPNNGSYADSGAQPLYTSAPWAQWMAPNALDAAGGALPHDNVQPYTVVNFCIALTGIIPQRP